MGVGSGGSWLLQGLWGSSRLKWPCTWMQVPVHSLQRLQDRAQRLAGMCEILVMGSIFSGQPMLTWAGQRELRQASRPQPAPRSPKWGLSAQARQGADGAVREPLNSTCFLTVSTVHWVP